MDQDPSLEPGLDSSRGDNFIRIRCRFNFIDYGRIPSTLMQIGTVSNLSYLVLGNMREHSAKDQFHYTHELH